MNFQNVQFLTSVYNVDNAPEKVLPEIVFAGRSNVGKSSMINKLLNRKNFARVSSVPGKTASINYYLLDEKLYFADLPGYGYARVSESEKKRWGALIEGYFNSSREITLVMLLVDVRHKPSDYDMVMKNYLLETGIPYIIVLTKCDKLSKSKLNERINELIRELNENKDRLFPFSAVTGEGKEELISRIERCVSDENCEI